MDQQRFEDMLDVVSKRTGIVNRTLLLQIPLAVFEAIYQAEQKDSGIREAQKQAHNTLLNAAKTVLADTQANQFTDTALQFIEATIEYLNAEKEYGVV